MVNNFCSECGNKLREDFKVCPYCGKKIIKDSKYKYCHVCGSHLNEEGKCDNCSVVVEVVESVKEEPKKMSACAMLSFIFSIINIFTIPFISLWFALGFVFGVVGIIFWCVFSVIGFVLQFFGRGKKASTTSKIFSWIAFGMSLFNMIISLMFLLSFMSGF